MKHLLAAALACLPALAAAQSLPPAIAASHQLRVAIVPNYPPLEFKDPATNQLTGFDVDLGEAIGKKLGLTLQWQETSFDQMIPAVTTGRVDAIMSGMTDLATRHDSASLCRLHGAAARSSSCRRPARRSSRTWRRSAASPWAPAAAPAFPRRSPPGAMRIARLIR